MAHNPRSNINNGVGYGAPARYTTPPMLGTDGIGADLLNEARTALFKAADARQPLASSLPLAMLGESARFASQALGVKLGVLAPNAAADLVLTNYRPATPLTADNLAGHVLFAMGPEFVRDVMIDGWWVLRNGHVVTCDEAAARTAAVDVSRGLYQRMAAIPCD
jgi:cytosine/adenosine deaminase-related metal-dependent hydrolase